ncbi:MAG: hypothetical protein R3195_07815 [Gemmatimonadota bacterium]|nr:hypothetical protein [Gemmatimonadota bacterium]
MMRIDRIAAAAGLVAIGVLSGCSDRPAGLTDPDVARGSRAPAGPVVVEVGHPDRGTDYFPPGSHDASYHAQDRISPRTTVISPGATVEFRIAAGHNVAVYAPGVTPADIDLSTAAPIISGFPPILDDPGDRIARTAVNFGPTVSWSMTFDEPGLYLVICEVLPHFVSAKMYAWVRVG